MAYQTTGCSILYKCLLCSTQFERGKVLVSKYLEFFFNSVISNKTIQKNFDRQLIDASDFNLAIFDLSAEHKIVRKLRKSLINEYKDNAVLET